MDFVLLIFILILPALASMFVSGSYGMYKNIENQGKFSGLDIARKILDENGLENIYVVETKGNLTDHYDPKRKVVRLSSAIYHGTSIASLAVAAHECGHAIQDKEGYSYMRLRSLFFPIVHFATGISYFVIFLGILMESFDLIWLGIVLVGTGFLFQLVTLPVEVDASRRAKKEIETLSLASREEQDGVRKMLMAAASTYLAGVLTSALEIIRLILIFGKRDD